uniref:Transmembrane protein n=1 Tax=Ditylenchus dipsaci TaxID=166011 RepID=A0A915E777_9BILA
MEVIRSRRKCNVKRNVIWPKLYSQICNKNVSFLIILSSFLFGANYFVCHLNADSTLNYNLENLRWMLSRHYQSNVQLSLSIGSILLTVMCAMAIARVVFDGLTDKNDFSTSARRWNILRDTFSVALFLITDLVFVFLIAYCHKKAMPFPSSKLLGIEKSSPMSMMDSFKPICLQALGIRTQLMMGSQPSLPMHDNNYSVNQVGLSVKFAAVPVLSFGRKTSSSAHRNNL